MKKYLILALLVFGTMNLCFAQGSENFENIPTATPSTYTLRTWTGSPNAYSWQSTDSRTDQTINTKAIAIRNGALTCNSITGGIANLTFQYKYLFSGSNGNIAVKVNGTTVANVVVPTSQTAATTATINGINISGTFNLELQQTVAGSRIAIDDVQWTGTAAACTPPATQTPTASFSAITSSTFDINWTPGSGTNSLVVLKQGSAVTGTPLSGSAYTASTVFGGGQTIASNEYVVYNGTGNTVSVTGLTNGTNYYAAVYSFNSADNCYNITTPATANTATSCAEPTVQVSAIPVTPGNTTASISWSGGNGNSSLVRVNTVNSFTVPVDGSGYSANTVYSSGEQTVYAGTGSSVNISGLANSTTYYVRVYTFNNCLGTPDYLTTGAISQNFTTGAGSGEPVGYYAAAGGLTCAALKTALSTIISTGLIPKTYGDLWDQYLISDIKPREVGPGTSPDVIWDIYSDNPTGTDAYNFTPGTVASGGQQDNGTAANSEGILYNREHSIPQSWFGGNAQASTVGPESDYFHIFPTDKLVNAERANNIYGVVNSPSFTSTNGSKVGPNTVPGLAATAFEPINAYKGDVARAFLYFVTRYQSNMAAWETQSTEGDMAFDGTTWPSVEISYLQMMLQWNNLDPVSQKETDRNNAGYLFQGNRNPYVDHPEFVSQVWSSGCGLLLPVGLTKFEGKYNSNTVLLNWTLERADGFSHFEIERSTDGGTTYHKTGVVLWVSGINAYSFTDDVSGIEGPVYYRLRMVDQNLVYKFSSIVVIKLPYLNDQVTVYPNPAKDVLNLSFRKPLAVAATVTLIDMSGRNRLVMRLFPGQTSYPMQVHALQAGRYVLKVQSGENVYYSHVVVAR